MSDETTHHKSRSGLKFDPTIKAGDVMTMLMIIVAGFAAWATLDKRVVVLEENRASQRLVDLHQNEMQRAEMSQIKDSLTEIKRSVERVNDQIANRGLPPAPPQQQQYRQQSFSQDNVVRNPKLIQAKPEEETL